MDSQRGAVRHDGFGPRQRDLGTKRDSAAPSPGDRLRCCPLPANVPDRYRSATGVGDHDVDEEFSEVSNQIGVFVEHVAPAVIDADCSTALAPIAA